MPAFGALMRDIGGQNRHPEALKGAGGTVYRKKVSGVRMLKLYIYGYLNRR